MMNIYDVNWHLVNPTDVDLEKGHLIDTQKKTVIKEAYDKTIVWDEDRGLKRYVTVPEEAEFEDCQQYILFTNSELITRYEAKLSSTDYITAKMTEAMAAGDTELLEQYKNKYADVIEQRKVWRAKIDELQNGEVDDEVSENA